MESEENGGGGTGGNPSGRSGGQLPLHRGAEDNTPQFAVGDQLSPYIGESRGILSDSWRDLAAWRKASAALIKTA